MILSKRLFAIANLINTKNVYDVGCDHALLDIYLSNNKSINCIAIDKSKECINKALENVKNNNSNVKVILNDGLTGINIVSDSTIILSGMGTKNILEIINNKDIECLICQSNKNIYELRKNVCALGYYIEDEKIVYETKFYIIIKFKKGYIKYNDKQFYLGPILLKNKNDTYVQYLNEMKKNIEKNIHNYDIEKKQKYSLLIKMIKEELN